MEDLEGEEAEVEREVSCASTVCVLYPLHGLKDVTSPSAAPDNENQGLKAGVLAG